MEHSKTHPLILVAAVAVTLASLAVAAHFTGLIPSTKAPVPEQIASTVPAAPSPAATIPTPAVPAPPAVNTTPPAEQPAQAAPAKAETTLTIPAGSTVTISPEGSKPVTAAKPAPKRSSKPARQKEHTSTASDVAAARQTVPIAPPICQECGTVESMQEIESKGQGTGLGAVAGGVLGGVLGHQIGKGSGKDAATVVGAVGGAVGGHQIEKSIRTEKHYQVTVRFDDHTTRTFTLNEPTWKPGDRVRLNNGVLSIL